MPSFRSLPVLAVVSPVLAALSPLLAQSVVINEIHYDPINNARPSEFIELHNPGTQPVDVSGWQFTDAIDYQFPAGTVVAPGGFSVVTRDLAALLADFKTTALGPWTGALSNSGERVRLRDAGGTVVDEVEYGAGFPWPTHAAGGGSSIELINPGLDNTLGGSWRSSPGPGSAANTISLIPPGESGWRFRRGTSEASDPVDAWRQPGFVEDATWSTVRTPLGYNDPNLATDLATAPWNDPVMQSNYISVFLRKEFVLPSTTLPTQLRVRVSVDDGCLVWINGVMAGRFNINGTDEKPYNAGVLDPAGVPPGAANHEAVTAAGAPVWQDLVVTPALVNLRPGVNTIAVHAFNESIGSSDFSIDTQLAAEFAPLPTPGAPNINFADNAPPQVRQVAHTPAQPKAGDPVIITARITDPNGVAGVTLTYQLVDPGAYIRRKDPAYSTNWTPLAMVDDGTGGDAAAGDGIFSVSLPGDHQTHRRLVRYRIAAADTLGRSVQTPYADDGSPNFAYFCYNGVPAWTGAFRPGTAGDPGTLKQFPEALLRERPAYHVLANQTDVTNSQYTNGQDTTRMQSTFVYEDQVLDHVTFHNRGEFSTYVSGKNKWRFHFNRTRELRPKDDYGRPYRQSWGDLNLNGGSAPWIAANRGMAGVEERLSFRMYELAGVPSPKTHYISLRVIDNTVESADPATNNNTDPSLGTGRNYFGQYSGDFWGQYTAIESPDGSFLDERGLPDGNVYKIEGGGTGTGDKKHQALGQPTTAADWTSFASASSRTQTEAWWRENLDLPAYYAFRAVSRIVGNVDMRDGWNHFFYHAPAGGWKPIPWDLDMMFVGRRHQSASGAITQDRCVTLPVLDIEKDNRCREFLDLLVSDTTPNGGQVGQLIDEFVQIANPPGQTLTWADLDAALWNFHPRTAGAPSTPPATATDSNHKGNFFYSKFTFNAAGGAYTRWLRRADFTGTGEHEDMMKYLLDYMTNTYPGPAAWAVNNGNQLGYGYEFLKLEANDPAIPARPSITYTGDPAYPANALRFQTSPFSDPQGDQTFAAVQWRLGALAAPGLAGYVPGTPRTYEVEEAWTSPELTTFSADVTLPATAARPGHTYRARARHKDATGRWSRWSDPVQFVASSPDISVYTSSLVISEIMYHPAPPTAEEAALGFTEDDFEYLEIMNTAAATVDLTDVRFTKGIDFDFSTGTQIAPGAHLLVVRNPAAFEKRYGPGKPVAGSFPNDQLRNSGEEVKLSYGAGIEIRSLTYLDTAPWPTAADGQGPSLQLVSPQSRPDHSLPQNWQASLATLGSPGAPDSAGTTFAAWAAAFGLPADPTADTDHDGSSNKLEYALVTDPRTALSTPAVTAAVEIIAVNGTPAPYPTLSFLRRTDATDLSYIVEFSQNLAPWSANGTFLRSVPVTPGVARDTWRSPDPVTAHPHGFGRVRVP
jgi:hypothetical protein